MTAQADTTAARLSVFGQDVLPYLSRSQTYYVT